MLDKNVREREIGKRERERERERDLSDQSIEYMISKPKLIVRR